MSKKRNCRRTEDENLIHAKAVKLRKMTDAQLVRYIEDQIAEAKKEGISQERKKWKDVPVAGHGGTCRDMAEEVRVKGITASIIEEIGQIKGIGAAKLQKIEAVLETKLLPD